MKDCYFTNNLDPLKENELEAAVEERTAELTKANAALKKSEARFREMVELLPDMIYEMDAELRFTYANHAAFKTFGYTEEDFLNGIEIDQLFAEEEMNRVHDALAKIAQGEPPQPHVYKMKRKDGSVFFCEITSDAIENDEGKLTGFRGVVHDITERKRTEEELKRAQSRLRIAMDLAKLVQWEYDVETDLFTFDDQFYALYGTTAEREGGPLMASQDYARKFIPEEEAPLVAEEIGKASATSDPNFTGYVEHRIIRGDGTEGFIAVRYGVVKDDKGHTIKTYGANQDITERKLAEIALKNSESKLAAIIDFLPDATLVINKEGRVIAWNRAMEAMTGIKAEDILGEGNYEYALPFYGERRPILIDLVLKSQEKIEARYEYITRSDGVLVGEAYVPNMKGGEVYLLGSAAALYDSDGNIAGAIESIRDITEHKIIERKLANESNKFKVLYDLALNMSAEKSLEENMAFIVDKSRELLNTDTSYIALLDETGQYVRMHTLSGIRTEAFKQMRLPLGKGLYGLVMETHKGYIIDDYQKNKDIKHVVDRIIANEGLISGMAVPVQIRDKSLGVLYVFNRRKTPFTQEDLDTLILLGNLAAVEIIRKHSSNESERQLNFLQQLIDAIPNPIFYKDTWGVYQGCNAAFESYIGLTKEEIVGKTVYEVFPKDLADIYYKADKSLFQNLGVQIYETEVVHADGTRRNAMFNKAPYFDTKGRLAGLVGVILDITERKKAEERQKESREYLNKIINSIADPIFVKDRNHMFVLVNDALCNLMGHLSDEILGRTDYDFFPEDQANVFWEKDKIVFESGEENINDEKITDAQGIIRDITTKKTLYTDNAGNQFIVGIIRDFTDRKRAEEAIKESERRLADIINFLPDATFVIDRDGRVIAWNRAIEALTGIKEEEILGKGNYEYALPFYGQRRPILIDLVLKPQEEIEKGYTDLKRQDGTLVGGSYMPTLKNGGVFLVGSAATLYDSEGFVSGAIESIRDITENKHAEEELRRAKDEAESAMRAKSEFLANMSHEIRTPMNAVIGMTGLLLNSDLDADQRECVEIIYSSGEALLSIINDILDWSKIEEGRVGLEQQPFDLRECIESSIDLVATSAADKGIGLVFALDEQVPKNLVGDITRLRQILVNLLSNAIKFTDKGIISVTVTSRQKGDRYEVCFAVKDTGIGIPANQMDRLFKSFSQIDMTTTRKYGGTGLGLAISKRLVEMMDGKIWVESEEGIGSTFYFTILADASVGLSTEKLTKPLESSADQPGNLRLLLAEDNIVNQKVAQKMLQKLGYHADVAANGLEVLQALERQPYDMILMDIQMPEMDGIEAAKAIRQRWPESKPKIIAITAYALEGDREKCLDAGMDGYISKPVKMEDLISVLSKYHAFGKRKETP